MSPFVVGLAFAAGCLAPGSGVDPPLDALYFPTGLAASPGRSVLFAASSDFDLQYSGGTVLALDLDGLGRSVAGSGRAGIRPALLVLRGGLEAAIDAALAAGRSSVDPCTGIDLSDFGQLPLFPNDNRQNNPGPCSALALPPFVRASATIGAFASNAVMAFGAPGQARLFVPVRGDPSVTYFDVSDDRAAPPVPACEGGAFCLQCGATDDSAFRCGERFRVGDSAADNLRGVTLPVEPFGIAVSPGASPAEADAIVVAHQTEATASLITSSWDPGNPPTLQYSLPNLPTGPTEVADIPVPRFVQVERQLAQAAGALPVEYQPGFLVTYRASAQVDLLRYYDDAQAAPPRPFLSRVSGVAITTSSDGSDSRGVVVDASERERCESACMPQPADAAACDEVCRDCLGDCTDIPLRLFVANRLPASLLVGEIRTHIVRDEVDGELVATGAYDAARIYDAVPLAFGASRLAKGHIVDASGALRLRIFAVAFDSRLIFGYDPDARRVDLVIGTGRGPHAIAFDTGDDGARYDGLARPIPYRGPHSFMYVAHFTDSYIGVVDLDARHPYTFGSMFASIGHPNPPAEAK